MKIVLLQSILLLLWRSQALAFSPRTIFQRSARTASGTASITTTPTQLLLSSSSSTDQKLPGTADLNWSELGFELRPTRSHLQITYKDGKWGEPELIQGEPYIRLHIGATALHYGQACFEGLKAFCHNENNEVFIFRPQENAQRMQSSCRRVMMPELPTELFVQAVREVVRDNIEYVPPYGSGGALYIRPLLFGSGPRIGLQPADEYTFIILVMPVGDYYKGGLSTPVHGMLIQDFDRAAPRGVGNVKVAGNYAADLLPNMLSKKQGYPIGLYADAATQEYVEEFSTSNFVGISGNKYITPKSSSVLPSITNKSLMQIAKDMGMTVEEREVRLDELEDMDEVLAVGTAVVVTPVGSITRLDRENKPHTYTFGDPDTVGPVTQKLYDRVRAIQSGEEEDKFGWNVPVN